MSERTDLRPDVDRGEEPRKRTLFSRIAADFTTRAWVLIPIGVGINVVGGTLANVLQLPLYLDNIGTILVAILAGPWVGAFTGFMQNIVQGFVTPTSFAFLPVGTVLGFVAGVLAIRGWFRTWTWTFAGGLINMATAVLIASPIVVLVFGGATGTSAGRSAVLGFFLATTGQIWQSVFSSAIIIEFFDKVGSTIVAVVVAKAIPERYRPQKARQTL